jgi:hypothetical protein
MREIRTSGSEGGGIESNRFSLPYQGQATENPWIPAFEAVRKSIKAAKSAAARPCVLRDAPCGRSSA